MTKHSVLLSGCSLSDYCGWGSVGTKTDPRCWYNILAKRHGLDISNISVGGRSNREIIHLASEEVLSNPRKYRSVILQLTNASRHWFFRETDPTQFCIINGGNISNAKTLEETQALRIIQLEFSPIIIEIKRDLVSLLMLQSYLHTHSINLILIDTMYAGRQMIDTNKLGSQIDLTYSSGFLKSWIKLQTDYADDNMHPGEQTNAVYADLIGEIISKIES